MVVLTHSMLFAGRRASGSTPIPNLLVVPAGNGEIGVGGKEVCIEGVVDAVHVVILTHLG